jgi:CheY-like chemotaxis protein
VPPKRILVVDDDNDLREIAMSSLELTRGWEVTGASCGREAIERTIASLPDAVLLDVQMPDMDGPTAFAQLRSDPRTANVPVILLTAKVQAGDRARYLGLGVEGVIAKPFDPLTLADTVATLLHWE